MSQDIGVYRLHSTGPILEEYFDWDTHKIGPYSVDPEYGYIEEYHVKIPDVPMRMLYKLVAEDPRILAAISINHTYIACLFEYGTMYYYYFEDGLFHLSSRKWTITETNDVVPIGLMRTRYKCQSVCLLPARLLYSKSRMSVHVNKRWIPIHEEPDTEREIPFLLYSELIKQGKEYVYYNKGGELIWKDS